jgi:hypothetical protein
MNTGDCEARSTITPTYASLAISAADGEQVSPDVEWNGASYLVVWEDDRSDGDRDIYGARVSPAGAVFDVAGIPIARAPGPQAEPALAASGSDWLVAWSELGSVPSAVSGTEVRATGVVAVPGGSLLASGTVGRDQPDVAWSGNNYLLVFRRDGTEIWGRHIDAFGVALGSEFGIGTGSPEPGSERASPRAAWNGVTYLVAWSTANGRVDAARVVAGGAPVGVFEVHPSAEGSAVGAPELAPGPLGRAAVGRPRRRAPAGDRDLRDRAAPLRAERLRRPRPRADEV